MSSRLDTLMRLETERRPPPAGKPSDEAKAEGKRSALHEECRTIDRLLSELAMSPLAGPSASGQKAGEAPLAYRRLEVLASSESMKRDMDLLGRIRDLTQIGTKASAGGGSGEDGSNIVNCPIVASERYNLPAEPEVAERLERLCFRVANLDQRTVAVSRRADDMLNAYGSIMLALSEKMVLAEEEIKGSHVY